jgi:hypothetical protein
VDDSFLVREGGVPREGGPPVTVDAVERELPQSPERGTESVDDRVPSIEAELPDRDLETDRGGDGGYALLAMLQW